MPLSEMPASCISRCIAPTYGTEGAAAAGGVAGGTTGVLSHPTGTYPLAGMHHYLRQVRLHLVQPVHHVLVRLLHRANFLPRKRVIGV